MGFSAHANNVIKANRTLLKKRRSFKELRKTYEGYVEETQLSFKQLSDFEQKKLKDKIRAQARLDKRHELFLFILAFLGVVILFCATYWLFT